MASRGTEEVEVGTAADSRGGPYQNDTAVPTGGPWEV
jgi:hypothetical protein